MKFYLETTRIGTINDIQDREDLNLLTDSQDVEHIKDYLGNHKDLEDFDGFFVKVEDADYSEIYAFSGSVAWLYKDLYQIDWGLTQ